MYMVTLKQYQSFCLIPTGQTFTKELSELLELPVDRLNNKEVELEINKWISKLVMSNKQHSHIKLKNKWFKVDRDLYNVSFSQFIYFDDTMRSVDDNVSQHIHELISAFIRPCRFYKFFPKKFSTSDIEKHSKLVQDMDIGVALELINFFFLYTRNSIRNTHTEFLGQLEKEIWEKVIE